MAETASHNLQPIRVIHVLRAPLGGLFRHVLDLSLEQARRGHEVGLIVDSTTGGEAADRHLADLSPNLSLGLSRVAMHRDPHLTDFSALVHVLSRLKATRPHVVHGHGSKGGAFARLPGLLPGGGSAIRAYTPHGGSLNHNPGSLAHRGYMKIEALLGLKTDMLLFESAYIGSRYRALVGEPAHMARVVHNGVGPDEFVPISAASDAADFIYVGELRAAKGIDILLNALRLTGGILGTAPTAVLVGTGPDRVALQKLAGELGLGERIRFAGALPVRRAFELGRVLVMPSRAESLPYVALEAAAARIPLVATNVGGIPEIFGPYGGRLIPPDDAERLSVGMAAMLAAAPAVRAAEAEALASYVRDGFSIATMVDAVIAAYRDAIAARASASAPDHRTVALLR